MKKLIIGLLILVPGVLPAQRMSRYHIPQVTVLGKRPMKEIGVEGLPILLKDNMSVTHYDHAMGGKSARLQILKIGLNGGGANTHALGRCKFHCLTPL